MKKSEFRNLIKRELIKEAKGTSYESKLAEIEKQGHITTLEAKIDAISEMIDAKNDRLSLVNEDENLSELIDKKKIKEMQREIKQLEKTKMKLEKLYEKKTGGKKKDVVTEDPSEEDMDHQDALDTASEEGDTKFMKEDARTDAEEEGYLDGMKDEKEDSMNEEFNLNPYNKFKTMNTPVNEEFLRMQKLAGIITEGEYNNLNEAKEIDMAKSFLENKGLKVEAVKSGNEGNDKAGEEGKAFIWDGGEGDQNYKSDGKEAFYVYMPYSEEILKEMKSKFPVIKVGGKSGNYYEVVIEKK